MLDANSLMAAASVHLNRNRVGNDPFNEAMICLQIIENISEQYVTRSYLT